MKQILKGMAEAAKKVAKTSVNSASFFAAYAYLSADDQSELSLIGYVEFSLLYDYDRYNFSASDQYGYNIEAATRTPYLTRYSCASYYVCSDTGSTTTNLNLKP